MIQSCRKCDKEMQDKDSATPLLLSVKSDKAKAVRALIKEGCDVSTTDKEGRTPVYWAVWEGHMEVLKASSHVLCFTALCVCFIRVVVYLCICVMDVSRCTYMRVCTVCLYLHGFHMYVRMLK